jgi:hypothetical protein
MQKIKVLLIIGLMIILNHAIAQQNQPDSSQNKILNKLTLFGNIYAGFYYGLNDHIAPRQAFELNSGLLGVKAEINKKIKAILVYDVYKTTSSIEVFDTSRNALQVNYYKGSDYTTFLKQAQIDWDFAKNIELSVGQLQNQQFLTLQDKFWGYRYIAYTFQERYKFGSPADFGTRLTYNYNEKIKFSIGAVNGDGPFSKQDTKGIMQYNTNLECFLVKNLILKFYFDISPNNDLPARMVYSAFAGYKTEKWRIGFEYNILSHQNFIFDENYEGISAYGSIKLAKKIDLLCRYDYIKKSATYKDSQYMILGMQYEPANNFFVSINGRDLFPADEPQLYVNFGIKF